MIRRSLLKEIRNLQQKKHRKSSGLFIAEGEKVAAEFLTAGWKPLHLLATDAWLHRHADLVSRHAGQTHRIDEAEMQRITALKTPSPVLLVLQQRHPEPERLEVEGSWNLALDTISDPGNLGTIIRIADWFGIRNVICSPRCAEIFSPKVVQASMGSLAHVVVASAPLESIFARHPALPVFGTDTAGPTMLANWKPPQAGMLLIGNESRGINPALQPWLHQTLAIPRYGHAESLNAAMAAAIVCYHLRTNA